MMTLRSENRDRLNNTDVVEAKRGKEKLHGQNVNSFFYVPCSMEIKRLHNCAMDSDMFTVPFVKSVLYLYTTPVDNTLHIFNKDA